MFTPTPPVPEHNLGGAILSNTRVCYATPRADVEQYVRDWYNRDDDVPHIRINAPKYRRRKTVTLGIHSI
jgi:hypothetical protein